MARDIAFVADKDTRDDFETRGEPGLPDLAPLPDGPRSEGGPASRPPDHVQEDPEPSAADPVLAEAPSQELIEPGLADAPEPPLAEAQPAAVDTGETEPEPAPCPGWHSVIADALSAAPAAEIPPSSAPASATAFTDAAEGLFRPGRAEPSEEMHLITLGRRLDPSLRMPMPVAPVIEPRDAIPSDAEPRTAERRPSDLRAEAKSQPSPEPLAEAVPAQDHRVAWSDATWRQRLIIAGRYAAYAVGGYLALVLVLILLFRFVNPPGSMLMLTQLLTGTSIDRRWVPISQISPALVRAVVVSEDDRFCEHSGIDTAAIREAIERASRGTPRGASTISMQVTKNLFLWNAKSYVRKIFEIPLTLFMELVWPKQRVLEVYLNIAEWGPGIFGVEAAAQHHFGKHASSLGEREAALLAVVLPNPIVRDAGAPSSQTSAKARVIQSRVKAYGAVASCVTSAAAPAAAAPAASPAAKALRPLRKAPARPAARRKAQDDWSPTLNFGN